MCIVVLYYNCTATSKQRAKLRKAISNDHKKLKKLAKQYNNHIQQYDLELPQAVEDDILSGQFPWSSLSSKLLKNLRIGQCICVE